MPNIVDSGQKKDIKPLSINERAVCELYAEGKSIKHISNTLGISESGVNKILNTPHIKEYVKELITEQYSTLKEGRLRIINKIIEDKLQVLEEKYGDDLSKATSKDVVDLIVIVDQMMKEREKKELGTEGNTYINILNQIIKD